jgi:mannose-1-phosphate guanylyltransferase
MSTSARLRSFVTLHTPYPAFKNHCSIVLAGGEGTRLSGLIHRWLGAPRPKQYCTFTGTRSMLQHTLDRARRIAQPEGVFVVIGKGHRSLFDDAISFPFGGTILEQPLNRGTAAGILLPLTHILSQDPAATVTILPSDHFLHPEWRFDAYAHHAAQMARRFDDKLILWGAVPDRAEVDYGWIQPGPAVSLAAGARTPSVYNVAGFHEKPQRAHAETCYRNRWLWNTMILTAKAATLQACIAQCLPRMAQQFSLWQRAANRGRYRLEPEVSLRQHYLEMEDADFSRSVLQQSAPKCLLMPMRDLHWCDWGRPERIMDTLDNLGIRPAFPADLVQERIKVSAN